MLPTYCLNNEGAVTMATIPLVQLYNHSFFIEQHGTLSEKSYAYIPMSIHMGKNKYHHPSYFNVVKSNQTLLLVNHYNIKGRGRGFKDRHSLVENLCLNRN